ncbi:MAG: hypothetical protein IMZ62_15960 [Chloroflexi bacterium]|nr:hypothetical protein [Chloroflexota bacterium]
MTKQIWKFALQPDDYIANGIGGSVVMPRGAKVIHSDAKDGRICLWALVNVGNESETRRFVIYGTGHDIEQDNLEHISTFQVGGLVFHVFEVTP